MEVEKVNGTLTMGKELNLTLRLYLTDKQRELFVLERGRTTSLNVVVMNKGDTKWTNAIDVIMNGKARQMLSPVLDVKDMIGEKNEQKINIKYLTKLKESLWIIYFVLYVDCFLYLLIK